MLSRIQSLGSCLMVFALLLLAGSAAAQDVSPRCEAAMDRAAAHYSKCLLLADASYARHENATKLENRQARCETRFERRTTRAVSRHGADECASADRVTAMADRTVSYAEGVATEANGEAAPSFLFVQNATGGMLTDSTLRLTGVGSQTGWFTDRPYRDAGRMRTADFAALFSGEGRGSFTADPPNANFTCELGGEAVNQVVTLTEPVLDEATDTLTYSITFVTPSPFEGGSFGLIAVVCDTDAHLFIDSWGTDANSVTYVVNLLVKTIAEVGCEAGLVAASGAVGGNFVALGIITGLEDVNFCGAVASLAAVTVTDILIYIE